MTTADSQNQNGENNTGSRIRQIVKASYVPVLLTVFIYLVNPFGIKSVIDVQSTAIGERVLAPWHRTRLIKSEEKRVWNEENRTWNITRDDEDTAVVLMTRRMIEDKNGVAKEQWPPSRRRQLLMFFEIFRVCPKAVFIDLYYDSVRDMNGDFFVSLLKAREAAECPGSFPIPLMFSDKAAEPCNPLMRLVQTLARGQIPRDSKLEKKSESADSTQNNCVEASEGGALVENAGFDGLNLTNISVARSSVSKVNENENYAGVSNEQYYPLIVDSGAAVTPALQMYFQWCKYDGRCDPVVNEFGKRYLSQSAGLAEGQKIDADSLDEKFGPPMDVQWRHYSPLLNCHLWMEKSSSQYCLKRLFCEEYKKSHCIKWWDRFGASLSMLRRGFFGSSTQNSDSQRSPLYPLITVPAHLLAPAESSKSELQIDIDALMESALSDKYVFVGLGDTSGQDVIDSATHGPLPGVFDHAMAFDNLKSYAEDYIRPPAVINRLGWLPSTSVLTAWELLLIPLVTVSIIAFRIRSQKSGAGDIERAAAAAQTYPKGRSPKKFGAWALILVTVCIVSMIIAFAFRYFSNLSLSNWIGIGLISMIPQAFAELESEARRANISEPKT